MSYTSLLHAAYQIHENRVAHRLSDRARVLAPLAEGGVGDGRARLEQPARRALRRLAGGREHEHIREQAVVAFLVSVCFLKEGPTFSSSPSMTSMSLSCLIVSKAAATSILTK